MKENYSTWHKKRIDRRELIAILEGLDNDELTREELSEIVCNNNLTRKVYFDNDEWKSIFKENGIKHYEIADLLGMKAQSFSKAMMRQSIAIMSLRKIEDKFGIALPYKEEL